MLAMSPLCPLCVPLTCWLCPHCVPCCVPLAHCPCPCCIPLACWLCPCRIPAAMLPSCEQSLSHIPASRPAPATLGNAGDTAAVPVTLVPTVIPCCHVASVASWLLMAKVNQPPAELLPAKVGSWVPQSCREHPNKPNLRTFPGPAWPGVCLF